MRHPYDAFDVTGMVALVTGASEGIGRELAIGLAEAGTDVFLCSRRVSEIEQLRHFVVETTGKVDILINNAGYAVTKPAWDVLETDWDLMTDTAFKGVFFCSQVIGSMMRETGYGKIINVSSHPRHVVIRSQFHKPSGNQKGWDVYILYAISIISIIWILMMPLDAKRFGWSPTFPLWLKIIGGLLLIGSLFFIFMTTAENTYLSTRVRIQSDRKQQVVSTGVYGLVRHPLYLGYLLLMIGGPLLLGSIAGLALGLLGIMTIVVRTLGEEKMLLHELEGYEEYRKKVKYRLLPFIW